MGEVEDIFVTFNNIPKFAFRLKDNEKKADIIYSVRDRNGDGGHYDPDLLRPFWHKDK